MFPLFNLFSLFLLKLNYFFSLSFIYSYSSVSNLSLPTPFSQASSLSYQFPLFSHLCIGLGDENRDPLIIMGLRAPTSHYIPGTYSTLHYTTLHYTTLHCTALHCALSFSSFSTFSLSIHSRILLFSLLSHSTSFLVCLPSFLFFSTLIPLFPLLSFPSIFFPVHYSLSSFPTVTTPGIKPFTLITSHHITSHHITSHYTTTPLTTPYHTTLHHSPHHTTLHHSSHHTPPLTTHHTTPHSTTHHSTITGQAHGVCGTRASDPPRPPQARSRPPKPIPGTMCVILCHIMWCSVLVCDIILRLYQVPCSVILRLCQVGNNAALYYVKFSMCCRSVLYWVESVRGTLYSLVLLFVSLWIVLHSFCLFACSFIRLFLLHLITHLRPLTLTFTSY